MEVAQALHPHHPAAEVAIDAVLPGVILTDLANNPGRYRNICWSDAAFGTKCVTGSYMHSREP